MGIQKYKNIFAHVSNANLCLNLEIDQKVQFSGLIQDFGPEAHTHVYIQNLTKVWNIPIFMKKSYSDFVKKEQKILPKLTFEQVKSFFS